MNASEPIDPYAPPQASGVVKAEPKAGALWFVSDGQLRVRDGASLPDVCLFGVSPGEPGERKTHVMSWCPVWARHLPNVAILGWMIWTIAHSFVDPEIVVLLIGMVLLGLLVWSLSKRGRLHLFQSDQATRDERRRAWVEGLIAVGIIFAAGSLMNWIIPGVLSKGGGGFIGGACSFVVVNLKNRRLVRACGYESGWFLLTNVDAAAIARLEEIQSRLDEPVLSRKPS